MMIRQPKNDVFMKPGLYESQASPATGAGQRAPQGWLFLRAQSSQGLSPSANLTLSSR